jgi:DNA-binding winged helix-turn-helix (wHTH) protein
VVSVRFGAFAFHADRRQLFRDGTEVHLTPKAFDLLAFLIERAPAVVRKTEIHQRLWSTTFVSDAAMVGLVKELRRALRNDQTGTVIRTAHRVGYAFAGSIQGDAPAQIEPPTTCWLVAGTRRIALNDGVNVIGRDPDSAIWLDVPGVSRRHAHIILDSGAASLEDLGSKNGTLVRDRPVRGRVALQAGDRIQLATELLVFHTSDRGISTATQPVGPPPSRTDSSS